MHRAVAYLALLVVAILTGCGGGNGGGGAGETDAGAAASDSLTVSAVDFAFEPSELEAEAGTVSIDLVNDGESPHALEIEGVDAASATIEPGETATLDVELEDGTYEIFCPVDGHRDLGMVGTLTVGSGAGGTAGDTGETETGETETGETETGDDEPRY